MKQDLPHTMLVFPFTPRPTTYEKDARANHHEDYAALAPWTLLSIKEIYRWDRRHEAVTECAAGVEPWF